jgi:hypothetical protein
VIDSAFDDELAMVRDDCCKQPWSRADDPGRQQHHNAPERGEPLQPHAQKLCAASGAWEGASRGTVSGGAVDAFYRETGRSEDVAVALSVRSIGIELDMSQLKVVVVVGIFLEVRRPSPLWL